jgi:folate-binding protein YgfZ
MPQEMIHTAIVDTASTPDGLSAPESSSDPLLEYAAVREGGAGLIDLSSRGRLLVSGSEAVPFLNGLITNDVKTLEVDQWMHAAFPNVQGRLIAAVRVMHLKDGFLIDTENTTHEQVLKTLERFTLAGDFHLTDMTEKAACISVQGKRASHVVEQALGQSAGGIEKRGLKTLTWNEKEITVVRASHSGEDGFDIFVATDSLEALRSEIVAAGARPVGAEALEILRIEAGEPRYGIDMDETNVVTETNLDDAVSYTKGCYIGQEIIARIKYRGHVAKKLTGFMFQKAALVERDARIHSEDGKEIGRVTSTTYSPHLGQTIALGYVKHDYLAPGTKVKIASRDIEVSAQVSELPFVG